MRQHAAERPSAELMALTSCEEQQRFCRADQSCVIFSCLASKLCNHLGKIGHLEYIVLEHLQNMFVLRQDPYFEHWVPIHRFRGSEAVIVRVRVLYQIRREGIE